MVPKNLSPWLWDTWCYIIQVTHPSEDPYLVLRFFAGGPPFWEPEGAGEAFAFAFAFAFPAARLGCFFGSAAAFLFFTIGLEDVGWQQGWKGGQREPGLARLSRPTASIALAKVPDDSKCSKLCEKNHLRTTNSYLAFWKQANGVSRFQPPSWANTGWPAIGSLIYMECQGWR